MRQALALKGSDLHLSAGLPPMIREDKGAQLYSTLQTGAQAGMQTLDQSLQALRQSGQISAETARRLARFTATFSP